jgi:hypothetical protein
LGAKVPIRLANWNAESRENIKIELLFDDTIEPNKTRQCSKNCYLQGALTAHAYAVKRETGEWKKVDSLHYIHRTFNEEKLYQRILHDKGGQAIEVFDDLSTHPVKLNAKIKADDLTEDICFKYLHNYGAGLVTRFHVDDNFRLPGELSYDGQVEIDPNKKAGHAMVLVGVRKDLSGNCWILLQNWWTKKQFVEVTLQYLKSSYSVLFFPTQKHTEVRAPLVTTNHMYTEADIDDGGDEDDEWLDETLN